MRILRRPPQPTMIDVRRYGARGDGVHDDAEAINRAIAVAGARAGSGLPIQVYLPAATYLVGQPIVIDNDCITLVGDGQGSDTNAIGSGSGNATLITPAADFPDDSYVIKVERATPTRPLGAIRFRGFRIGQRATLSNTVHGIHFKTYRGSMRDVYVQGMSGNGIVVQGESGWNTYETKFDNVHSHQNGGDGWRLISNTADMHFSDCLGHGNGGAGWYVLAASTHYESCHAYSNGTYNLHVDGGGTRSKWNGCKFEHSGLHNVYIDSTNGGMVDLVFSGCTFNAAGDPTNNTYDVFHVGRSSGSATSSGVIDASPFDWNSTSANNGVRKQRYHLNLTAAARNWRIGDTCKFDGNARTAKINWSTNSVRCVIAGVGQNAGDPNTEGEWFGNEVAADVPTGQAAIPHAFEGLRVWDYTNSHLYLYVGGAWRQIA